MIRLIVRLLINAASIYLTAYLVEGISVNGFQGAIIAALAFGLMNMLVKPILALVTLPLTILTLGLFSLVINGITLLLTSMVVDALDVRGLGTAIIGALVISLINWVLSVFLDRSDND